MFLIISAVWYEIEWVSAHFVVKTLKMGDRIPWLVTNKYPESQCMRYFIISSYRGMNSS